MTLIFALLGYAVIPYAPGLALSDFNLGILYMLAVSSLATYGILLAGWSANSKYAFLGSLRSTAQLISYELILSSAILVVIMLTGSLNLTANIEAQRAIWFIFPLLPIFIIFFIGSIAETNRAPFDLSEATPNVLSVFLRSFVLYFIYFIPKRFFNGFILSLRFFSSISHYSSNLLHPDWITGFVDGEGCFGLKIYKSKGFKFGFRLEPFFQIKLNRRDIGVLQKIQAYFGGVGKISFEKDTVKFIVRTVKELLTIIPHFEQYTLLTQKYSDFELFRRIILIMAAGGHSTEEGFIKILSLRYFLNKGISEELKELYPNLVPVERPIVPEREISPEWLVGFVDGEGSFSVITSEVKTSSSTTPISRKVWLYFQITQHGRDVLLLEKIVSFLGCGTLKKRNIMNFNAWDYKLVDFSLMDSIIIPFFTKYPLQSAKAYDWKAFTEAADLIKNKSGRSWTEEEFSKIKSIKETMNKYIKES